jgi:serine protease Do
LLLPQLREGGRVAWSWTGLQLQPLRDFDRNIYFEQSKGVIVAETDPESPARRAGLRPRDRIVSINGEPVTALTAEDLPDVRRRIAMLPMHEPAELRLARDGEALTIELTPREKGQVEGEELVCDRWDLTFKTINQFDNPGLFFHRKQGVFVYGLKRPGNAAAAGLQVNDIILEIDGTEVRTLEDVRRLHETALRNVQDRHRLVLVVLRGGLRRHVVLDFSRNYDKR